MYISGFQPQKNNPSSSKPNPLTITPEALRQKSNSEPTIQNKKNS